jgi:hypothetical protein
MLRNALYGVVLTIAVAGCSSLPMMTKEEPDTTPQNPTAVLETHVVSDGIKGFLPFEGTNKIYTRADMHRDDTAFKGTGTVSRFFVGTNSTSRIERLDRKLVWTMDVKDKTYTECPLKGCAGPVTRGPQEKKPEKQDQPRESECKVKIASTTFTVKPTGQKKAINGFDTDEYQAVWQITLQDPQARKTVSTLNVALWTTPVTPALKEAMAVEQAYARSLASNMAAVTTNDKTQVVPAEAAKMINAYLATLMGTSDKSAFLNAGKQLEKIKGQPVLTQLEWDMKGDACAEKQADTASSSGGSKDLMSSVTDFFSSKKGDDLAAKPIFSFTSEVKSHKVEAVHDSVFSPPKGYALANPK